MEIEQIVIAVLFIVLVIGIGLCVRYAFKKGKGTQSTSMIEKRNPGKKIVSDVEDLDLRKFFVNKKHS